MNFVRAGNNLIDPEKVSAIIVNEKDNTKVLVILDNGRDIHMSGVEASEIWKVFDEKGSDWRNE